MRQIDLSKAVLLVTLAVACGPAAAQVTVNPMQARPFEPVRVLVTGEGISRHGNFSFDQHDPLETRISMAGNRITVALVMNEANLGIEPSEPLEMPLGSLPAGNYVVEVVRRARDGRLLGSIGSAAFTVADRSRADPVRDMTGLWWEPQRSGNGMTFTQSGNTLFATWYVFDADRRGTWFVISDAKWSSSAGYVGSVYRVTGPGFADCHMEGCPIPFQSSQVQREVVGKANIWPDGYSDRRATVLLEIDGKSYYRLIERFAF